jgi:hypothetical protein
VLKKEGFAGDITRKALFTNAINKYGKGVSGRWQNMYHPVSSLLVFIALIAMFMHIKGGLTGVEKRSI